ncbi:hypothetical protein TL16_g06377 [Triparma laevis f. inornata]|uniref:Uncharacterized protein n=1 Tax=Triparma laevis f. inornata TaxID=1714386 RepID=A0A9W7AN10_9STRA|nr:hypothetical protein TL16_g06377 [Triparma laevis f. inornata]
MPRPPPVIPCVPVKTAHHPILTPPTLQKPHLPLPSSPQPPPTPPPPPRHGDALEKDWSKKIQPICTFTTVENFWQYYNHIPKPGKCFFDGESRASVGPDNKVIDELSLFKKGTLLLKGGVW